MMENLDRIFSALGMKVLVGKHSDLKLFCYILKLVFVRWYM